MTANDPLTHPQKTHMCNMLPTILGFTGPQKHTWLLASHAPHGVPRFTQVHLTVVKERQVGNPVEGDPEWPRLCHSVTVSH